MKAIFLIALRNLTYRPGRSVSCALGISLGLAIVMAVIVVDHNTILSETARKPDSFGEPEIQIVPHRPNPKQVEAQRDALLKCPGLLNLACMFKESAVVAAESGKRIPMELFGLDSRAAVGYNAYEIKEGQDLDFTGPPGVLLSPLAAKWLEVKIGDRVGIYLDRPIPNVCRDGKIVPMFKKNPKKKPPTGVFTVRGLLKEKNMGVRKTAVIPFTQGLPLTEGGHLQTTFWAKLKPGYDLPAIKERLKNNYNADKPHKRALIGRSPEEDAFRKGVKMCALLSLLLGLYIIFNSMSMSLVERIRQIGLLRAMGLTRAGLTWLFLAEGFILTLAGCLLSLLITVGIVALMAAQDITTIGAGHPLEIIEIPWLQLLGVMALGTVFALLGVIYPIGKASSLSVIQAIRKGTIEFERQPFKGVGRILLLLLIVLIPILYFTISPFLVGRALEAFNLVIFMGIIVTVVMGILLFFPLVLHRAATLVLSPLSKVYRVAGKLAQNSLTTSRLRVFSTVSGLALVFAAIFVITAVTDSLEAETETWCDQNLVQNAYVRGKDRGVVKDEDLKNIPGVAAVFNLSAEVRVPFPLRGVDTDNLLTFGPLKGKTELKERLKTEDWIIVSKRLAKVYKCKKDERISLSSPLAGKRSFTVWAVTDEYCFYPDDKMYAIISKENMGGYFCVTPDQGIKWSLRLEEGANPKKIHAILNKRLKGKAEIRTGEKIKTEYIDDLHNSFYIFKIIIGLVAVLSGLSILNSLVIAIVEQKRGTALLRVVGVTPDQLKGILFMEAFSLGSLGGIFGFILGAPIAALAILAVESLSDLDLEITFLPQTIALTIFGAIFVSLLASIYPMMRQGGTDIMEAVKFE